VAAGAAAVPGLAKAEPRQRRYTNGKLICRCDAPEFDAVSEPEQFWAPYGGAHTHTGSGVSLDGSHSHSFSQLAWRTRVTNHCIYCGGIEAPETST
jgi:hypothetical protein